MYIVDYCINCTPVASGKMSNILDMIKLTKLLKEPMKLTESFTFFWHASLLNYACFDTLCSDVLLLHVYKKCWQRRHIFFFYVFLQNEMYCIFCPDSGNVLVFLHLVEIFS